MNLTYYIGDTQIDLFDNESIPYIGKLVDIQDITSLFSDFIETFSIPATSKNNKLLKKWFEVGIDNGFNPNKRLSSTLEVNTLPFRKGKTQLEEIKYEKGEISSYQITFYSEVSQLNDILGDTKLSDLPLSKYNFTYDIRNIRSLFENPTLLKAEEISTKPNFIMPFILPVDREVQYLTNDKFDISNDAGRLNIRDFRPAIRQSTILKEIENFYTSEGNPINFTNDFKNSNEFSNLFMYLSGKEDFEDVYNWYKLELSDDLVQDISSIGGVDIKINNNNTVTVRRTGENLDAVPGISSTDSYIYSFRIDVNFFSSEFSGTPFRFRLVDNDTNEVVDENNNLVDDGSLKVAVQELIFTPELEEINEKTYRIEIFSNTKFNADTTVNFRTGWRRENEQNSTVITIKKTDLYPQEVDVKFDVANNMPDMTVSDYIKNMIKQFKLIIKPLENNTFLLQGINDYYENGDELDITNISDKESINTKTYKNKKEIDFKFSPSEDIISQKKFFDNFKRYIGNSKKEFDVDNNEKETVEIDFEVPPFIKLTDANQNRTNINHALYGELKGREVEKVFPEGVLQFYYNGLTAISNDATIEPIRLDLKAEAPLDEDLGSGETADLSQVIDISSIPICDASNNYRFFQVTNSLDFSDTTINGWHLDNIVNNIYNVNHKPWIDILTNPDNRLFNIESYLSPSQIRNLDINTTIIYENNKYNIESYSSNLINGETEFTLFPNFTNKFNVTGTQLSNTRFDFNYGGGFATLTIRTEQEINEVNSNADWLEIVDINTNNRITTVLFYVEERFLDVGRITSLNVRIGSNLTSINVYQDGRLDDISQGAIVSVDDTNYTFSFNGGTQSIGITSNTFWEILNFPEGISFSKTFGFGDETVDIIVDPYTGFSDRDLDFEIKTVFQNSGINVNVLQEAEPVLDIVQDSLTASKNNETLTFNVVSNGLYNVVTSTPWINIPTSAHNGSKQISITVDENTTVEERVGIVTAENTNLGISDTITITQQEGLPFITITSGDITTDFREDTFNVVIESNIDYGYQTFSSWINFNFGSGNGNNTLTGTVDLNTAGLRTGLIRVRNIELDIEDSINITQQKFINPAPSTPTNLEGEIVYSTSGDLVQLNWNASTSEFFSIDYYEVYRSKNFGSFTLITTLNETTYTDSDIEGGNNYRYKLKVVDTQGDKSGFSQISEVFNILTTLSLSQNSINIPQQGGTFNIDLFTNTTWASNNLGFLSLNPSSGNGNANIEITYPSNPNTSTRQQVVEFRAGDKGKNLVVNQAQFIEELSATPTVVNAGSNSGSYTLNITSNTDWDIINIPSWVSLSQSSGNGNDTITVSYNANTAVDDRIATFTLQSGQGSRSVSLRINQAEFVETLSIDPTSKLVGSNTESYALNVNSNTGWNVESLVSWITVNPDTDGNGNEILGITIDNNASVIERSHTFIIVTDQRTKLAQHTVNQDGFTETLTINQSSRNVSQPAGSFTIDLDSNTNWSVISKPSWVTVSPSSASGDRIVTINYQTNSSVNSRSGVVTFRTGQDTVSKTLTINQAEFVETLSVNKTVINAPTEAGSTTFQIISNTETDVSDTKAWLSVSPSNGTGNRTVTVSWGNNNFTSPRSGIINISTGQNTLQETITVNQEAFVEPIEVTPTSYTFGASGNSNTFNVDTVLGWTVSSIPSWITASTTLGNGNGSFTLTAEPNLVNSTRSDIVVVTDDNGNTENLSLSQAANTQTLSINPQTKVVTGSANSYTINVTSNTSWTVTENVSWVSLSSNNGILNDTITVFVSRNSSTTSDRSADIIFETPIGLIETHSLLQNQSAGGFAFNTLYDISTPDNLCRGIAVNEIVYGISVDWNNNNFLYSDLALTVPASSGFYELGGVIKEVINGNVVNTTICSGNGGGGLEPG